MSDYDKEGYVEIRENCLEAVRRRIKAFVWQYLDDFLFVIVYL